MVELLNEVVTFTIKQFPFKFVGNKTGYKYEITKPAPGRYGLKIDGVGMMGTPNLYDVYEYIKDHGDNMPEGSIRMESSKPRRENYDYSYKDEPKLLNKLVRHYSLFRKSPSAIWNEIVTRYGSSSLADDVIEALSL